MRKYLTPVRKKNLERSMKTLGIATVGIEIFFALPFEKTKKQKKKNLFHCQKKANKKVSENENSFGMCIFFIRVSI